MAGKNVMYFENNVKEDTNEAGNTDESLETIFAEFRAKFLDLPSRFKRKEDGRVPRLATLARAQVNWNAVNLPIPLSPHLPESEAAKIALQVLHLRDQHYQKLALIARKNRAYETIKSFGPEILKNYEASLEEIREMEEKENQWTTDRAIFLLREDRKAAGLSEEFDEDPKTNPEVAQYMKAILSGDKGDRLLTVAEIAEIAERMDKILPSIESQLFQDDEDAPPRKKMKELANLPLEEAAEDPDFDLIDWVLN